MSSNNPQKSQCGCHRLLLLGDADAKIDDNSINLAIETQTNICRYLSFEQSTVGMMAMRLLCMPHQSAQSVFPHDCAYLRRNLFANINRDHPIYRGLSGAKRALATCNEPQSKIVDVSAEERPTTSNYQSRTSSESRRSSPVISTDSSHRSTRRASSIRNHVQTSERPEAPASDESEIYEQSALQALIIDYKNPIKECGSSYYPGPPSDKSGLSRRDIEKMSRRRIEYVEATRFRGINRNPNCNTFYLVVHCKYRPCNQGRRVRMITGEMSLTKFIYCQDARLTLQKYLTKRAQRVQRTEYNLAYDSLFKRYPLLARILPTDISRRPRSQNRRTRSPSDTSVTSDSQDDEYDSDGETVSESSMSSDISILDEDI